MIQTSILFFPLESLFVLLLTILFEIEEIYDTNLHCGVYSPQSGEYAQSKREAQNNRKKKLLERNLKVLRSKTRACKNAHKGAFATPIEVVERKLDKYVPHNGTQWMPFFGFMTSDVTGYWHSAFLLEIAFVHAPRLFRFVFTLVSIRNEFVDTLDRFLRVVSEPFRRDLRLWRSVPVHLSATGALVRNSYMATSLFACDSNNVEKWMALVTGLITST